MKTGGGEKQKGVGLSKGIYFTRFPMLFPTPMVWAFVSLLVADAKSSVCVFVLSERAESPENF